jgi:uncharacterized membrane protein
MRGIAMVLMASDHASNAFNAGRLVTDLAFFYEPGQVLDPLQFGFRWISHLCAPTFLFLAGTSLALSVERKQQRGVSSRTLDRDLLIRGLVILGVDLLFINWFWAPGMLMLGVMYAIGMAMILMVPLRRLPTPWLIATGLVALITSELFLPDTLRVPFALPEVLAALLVGGGDFVVPIDSIEMLSRIGLVDTVAVAYPVLPWWGIMALGWGFGRYLLRDDRRWSPARLMGVCGCASLVLFALFRGFNAYGNMRLLRDDGSWVQWLHVGKYPPSITFATLELGLMALVISGLLVLQRFLGEKIRYRNPILVFGQTAFFFYVAHIFLFEVTARALGMYHQRGLGHAVIATLVGLLVLYPICLWYRRFKAIHPQGWTRFF